MPQQIQTPGANPEPPRTRPQKLLLDNRSSLAVSGVDDVLSFDDRTIVMKTALGTLSVDGDALRILKLNTDTGELFIEGHVDGMFYLDETSRGESKGIFGFAKKDRK